jgi:hypothetical protein
MGEVRCSICGERVKTDDDAEIVQVTRVATESGPAAHVIVATDASGSRLLHRCVVED